MATDLLLEVVPLPVADYFFGAMTWQRGFLRIDLVGEKPECWDSALNKNTSLWWRFSYAINRMVDLTLQVKGKLA